MALLKREKEADVTAPASSQIEVQPNERPSWLTLLAAFVAILIVSTGLVFAGRWIYRSTHHKSAQPAAPTSNSKINSSNQSAKPGSQTTPPPPNSSTTSPPPPASTSTSPPPSSTTNTPPPPISASNSVTQLPQNGPGNVVTLFIGSSLSAAGLHYLIGLRRQKA